jgi:hypothetical protein
VPLYVDFDPVNKILRFRIEGKIANEELHDCYERFGEIASILNPAAAITDLSGASLNISHQAISDLARRAPALRDPQRPRIIVAPDPLVFGMARIFETEGAGSRPNLYVVQSVDAALAILGITEAHFTPYNP